MSYVGIDFDPSDPDEVENYGFDFTRILGPGETITEAAWTCEAVYGIDEFAASRLVGPALVTATQTQQLVVGLLPGVRYMLHALVTTSVGQSLSLWGHVQCTALS